MVKNISVKFVLLTLFLLFLFAFLRFYGLGHESLWTDEAFSALFPAAPFNEWLWLKYEVHPPLYYVLMHYFLMFGHDEFTVRLPSAICGIITLIFAFKLADGNEHSSEALLTLILLGLSSMAISIDRLARMYSLLCMLCVVAAFFLKKALSQEKAILPWIGYVMVSVALLYTQYSAFIFLFSVNIYFFIFWKHTGKYLVKWIICQILIGLSFLPWLNMFLGHLSAGGGQLLPAPDMKIISDVFIHLIYGGIFSIPVSCYPFIFIPVFIIFYFGGISDCKKRNKWDFYLPVCLFIIPLIITLLISIFTSKKIFSEKHFYYVIPFLYIVLARGIEHIRYKTGNRIAVVLMLLFLSLNISSVYNRFFLEKHQNADWRASVAQMERLAMKGDVILIQDSLQCNAFYYYNKKSFPSYTIGPENVPDDIAALAGSYDRIWLFRCLDWLSDPRGLVRKWLSENCILKERYVYFRIDRGSIITVELYECRKR